MIAGCVAASRCLDSDLEALLDDGSRYSTGQVEASPDRPGSRQNLID
jgi:hypothetical protein